MTPLLNYFVVANLCLLFFLVIYLIGLQKETQFVLKRAYLMGALVFSLIYPVIELPGESGNEFIPSVSHAVPSYLLPELLLNNQPTTQIGPTAVTPIIDFWTSVRYLYLGGLILFFGVFVVQLVRLLHVILQSKKYSWNNCWVAESEENKATFSFFKFIFIGNVGQLNDKEKQVVLRHESIHAHRLHSLDLLLLNLVGIVFWFNPFIRVYKRLLIQLHEFEADALTIENYDVKSYCNLMAKLALQSAGFSIVNHFNQSLTIERITMMKTMKKNVKSWKAVAIALAFPICFFVVACQDQMLDDVKGVAQNSTMSLEYPEEVQSKLEELKKSNPDGNFKVIELTEDGSQKLASFEKTYGAKPERIVFIRKHSGKGERSFAILDFNEQTSLMINATTGKDNPYIVVEEVAHVEGAQPIGGLEAYYRYISDNIKISADTEAQGKVFVQFVVQEDGSVAEAKVVKGLAPAYDQEAVRVIVDGPKWNPGKQRGKAVQQRLIIPIAFGTTKSETVTGNGERIEVISVLKDGMKMAVSTEKSFVDGKAIVKGSVINTEGKPVSGAHVIISGTSTGTVSNEKGEFTLRPEQSSGKLSVSFVGYNTAIVNF